MKKSLFTLILATIVGITLQAQITVVPYGEYFKVSGVTKANTFFTATTRDTGAVVYISDVEQIITTRKNVVFKNSQDKIVLRYSVTDVTEDYNAGDYPEAMQAAVYTYYMLGGQNETDTIPPEGVIFEKAGDFVMIAGLKVPGTTRIDPTSYFYKGITAVSIDNANISFLSRNNKTLAKFAFTDLDSIYDGQYRDLTLFTEAQMIGNVLPGGRSLVTNNPESYGIVVSDPFFSSAATGEGAIVLGGESNIAEGLRSATIAGHRTATITDAEFARAVSPFDDSTYAQAQTSSMIFYLEETHSAGADSILQNGAASGIPLVANSAATFEIQVIGITDNAAKAFSYKIVGVAKNANGTTSVVASTVTAIAESSASFDCYVAANNTDDVIEIRVKDASSGGDKVRWVATVNLTQVKF